MFGNPVLTNFGFVCMRNLFTNKKQILITLTKSYSIADFHALEDTNKFLGEEAAREHSYFLLD